MITSVLLNVRISHLTTFASSGTGLNISGLCGDFSVCHELCCIRPQGTWARIIILFLLFCSENLLLNQSFHFYFYHLGRLTADLEMHTLPGRKALPVDGLPNAQGLRQWGYFKIVTPQGQGLSGPLPSCVLQASTPFRNAQHFQSPPPTP